MLQYISFFFLKPLDFDYECLFSVWYHMFIYIGVITIRYRIEITEHVFNFCYDSCLELGTI